MEHKSLFCFTMILSLMINTFAFCKISKKRKSKKIDKDATTFFISDKVNWKTK